MTKHLQEPKLVSELETEEGKNSTNKSPSNLIIEFLRKNPTKAYKASQLQALLGISDYWAVKYACKSLVLESRVRAFKANPTWYSWKG
jgi:hypothetical protein